jgi:paraquat-inducible protein B
MEEDLRAKSVFLTTIAREINFIASRAQYEACEVTNKTIEASENLQSQVVKVNRLARQILGHTQAAEYRIAVASFQVKMLERFVQQTVEDDPTKSVFTPQEIAANIAILSKTMIRYVNDAIERIAQVTNDLRDLEQELDGFEKILSDFKRISAADGNASISPNAESLLPEMDSALKSLEPEVLELQGIRAAVRTSVEHALTASENVRPLLNEQASLISSLTAC